MFNQDWSLLLLTGLAFLAFRGLISFAERS
ncbi:hypothetical protein SAMN05880570_2025 [Paenibacillus sp. RU4T]|nr:hypothetical protein SAMN05880555_2027 [Paenibacillus sp. RU4X]SIQ75480.1 hypothetical protein SAMN05880570_2025 [Paenibacillus sp. RU4T]